MNEMNEMNENAIKEKYLKLNNIKLQTAKLISLLMIAAALLLSWFVFETPPKAGMSRAVYDEAEILSDAAVQKMEGRSASLAELTDGKARLAVFTEKEKSNYRELEKKAEKLFKSHKLGDDGLLFVAYAQKSSGGFGEAIGEFFGDLFGGGGQRYAYQKGRNVDYIPDAEIKRILDASFAGIDEEENFDRNAAFLTAYDLLADLFDAHYEINSHDHASGPAPDDAEPGSNIAGIVRVVFGTVALFVILFFVVGILAHKNKQGASRVYKKPFWFGPIG